LDGHAAGIGPESAGEPKGLHGAGGGGVGPAAVGGEAEATGDADGEPCGDPCVEAAAVACRALIDNRKVGEAIGEPPPTVEHIVEAKLAEPASVAASKGSKPQLRSPKPI